MGTHPIFESDFDCLTDKNEKWVISSPKLKSSQSWWASKRMPSLNWETRSNLKNASAAPTWTYARDSGMFFSGGSMALTCSNLVIWRRAMQNRDHSCQLTSQPSY